MRLASVSQFAVVISVLLTLAICSTLIVATCLSSGTAATRSSPRNAPGWYSARLVEVAPFPEIVPPVDSTHTTGSVVWPTASAGAAAPASHASSTTPACRLHAHHRTRMPTLLIPPASH